MTMNKLTLLSFTAALFLSGCGKDLEETHEDLVGPDGANTVVAMSMAYTHDGAAFDTSMTLTDAVGTHYKIDQLRFYMGGFRFTDDNGDSVAAFPEKYHLVTLTEGGMIRSVGELNGHLHELHFGLGVDSVLNHTDPLLVDAPLGVNGIYWTWAQGYLFLTIDGRWDSNGDGTVGTGDQSLSYHCGMDTLYTPVTLVVNTDADQGGNVVIPLDLDIDTLMAGVDIPAHPVVHEVTPITRDLMLHLAAGLSHVE
jgi:hypothetical protein